MDKFLIANNPQRDTDEIFIVHCLSPIFLIRVIRLPNLMTLPPTEESPGSSVCNIPPVMGTNSMHQRYLLRPGESWVLIPVISGTDIEQFTREYDKMALITNRASRWFRTYRTEKPNGHHVEFTKSQGPAKAGENKGL